MRQIPRILRILVTGVALGALTTAPGARAEAPAPLRVVTEAPALIRIAPAVLLVEPGGVVTASIVITDVAGLYGAAATLSLEAADPRGVTARVRMPWRRAAQATPSLAAEGAT